MLKSQHFIFLVMLIILAITLLTFILTYSLLPPKKQTPPRSRIVVAVRIKEEVSGKLQLGC